MTQDGPPVGLVLGSALPPERCVEIAQRGERLGFAELWLAEDYFFTGGIAGATAVLGATKRIPVGLGIVSAMVRHPALLAMEVATMTRMHPAAFGRALVWASLRGCARCTSCRRRSWARCASA